MLVEVGDGEKQATAMGVPVKLSATPGRPRSTAPAPGQHTADLLRELGDSESESEDLKAGKVVV